MEVTDMNWRKSRYSSNGGANCVEVGTSPDRVAIRDTTDRDGGTLAFSAEEWQKFITGLK